MFTHTEIENMRVQLAHFNSVEKLKKEIALLLEWSKEELDSITSDWLRSQFRTAYKRAQELDREGEWVNGLPVPEKIQDCIKLISQKEAEMENSKEAPIRCNNCRSANIKDNICQLCEGAEFYKVRDFSSDEGKCPAGYELLDVANSHGEICSKCSLLCDYGPEDLIYLLENEWYGG